MAGSCLSAKNAAGMFVWAKINNGKTSEQVIDELLYDSNIFIAPGNIFGSNGEGYVRFSLCVSKNQIKEALERI